MIAKLDLGLICSAEVHDLSIERLRQLTEISMAVVIEVTVLETMIPSNTYETEEIDDDEEENSEEEEAELDAAEEVAESGDEEIDRSGH